MPILSNPTHDDRGTPTTTGPDEDRTGLSGPAGPEHDTVEQAEAPPGDAVVRFDEEATPPPTPTRTTASTKRRWPWIVAGVGVAGAATAGIAIALGSDDSATDDAAPVTVNAVSAEVRDLVEFTDLDGRMVYADTVSLTAASDGIVTDVVNDGDVVERGAVLYEVNDAPVTVLYGDVPLYRDLSDGAVGDDVRILERNLASLGYHTFEDEDGNMVDTGFVVDNVFDNATVEAVERWQEDLGVATTGSVAASSVVVVDGPAVVSNLAIDVGTRVSPGTPALDVNTIGAVDAAYAEHTGEIELFVLDGAAIASGDIVYTVDELPITAIVSAAEFDRDLSDGVDPGEDVAAIEEMLVSLGYDADGELVVDDEFDESTTEAITDWQEDLQNIFEDLEIDGEIALDDIIVIEPGSTVGAPTPVDGDIVASGTELWSTTSASATRIVETAIAVADQDALAEGTTIDVEFPDGEIVAGVVTEVATSSTIDPADPDAAATLAVEIELPSVPESVADLNEIDVEVKLVEEIAAGATVVPVSALVAVGDGDFAVEAVTTTGTVFVAVDPGMFSDGWVEVTGIEPGTQVVVP